MAYPPPPYADAVCGTPVCGEAITGAWWSYPPTPSLGLGAYAPVLTTSGEIPTAGLALGAVLPALKIDVALVVPQPGLALGANAPTIVLSTILTVTAAGLALDAYLPRMVGHRYIDVTVCRDLALVTDPEAVLALVAAPAYDLALAESECR